MAYFAQNFHGNIKLNMWTQISFNTPSSISKTQKFAVVKIEKNAVKSEVIF